MGDMMKLVFVLCCVAYAAAISAHDVELLQEEAGAGGDREYRVTFQTVDDEKASEGDRKKFGSESDWKIEVKGKSGTTGAKDLISHPGFGRASDKDPWVPNFGAIQTTKFKASDVGEVTEVK